MFYFWKDEQEKLRQKINEVVELNSRSDYNGSLSKLVEIDSNLSNYKQISEDTINNLKEQVQYATNVMHLPLAWATLFRWRIHYVLILFTGKTDLL